MLATKQAQHREHVLQSMFGTTLGHGVVQHNAAHVDYVAHNNQHNTESQDEATGSGKMCSMSCGMDTGHGKWTKLSTGVLWCGKLSKNTVHRGPTQEWTREASFRPQGQGLLTAYTLWVTPPHATMWLLLTKAQ